MEIVKRAIRLMHEGKCIYDQFQLDEDYNVPDAKEDVGNVIEGIVCVKKEKSTFLCSFPYFLRTSCHYCNNSEKEETTI